MDGVIKIKVNEQFYFLKCYNTFFAIKKHFLKEFSIFLSHFVLDSVIISDDLDPQLFKSKNVEGIVLWINMIIISMEIINQLGALIVELMFLKLLSNIQSQNENWTIVSFFVQVWD